MVLLEIFAVPPKLDCNTLIELVPPVQLLNVFPVMVLGGVALVPSLLNQPEMVVAPVTVIFEKLLLLLVTAVVDVDDPPSVYKDTVPPAPVLLNAVTILFEFTVLVPEAGAFMLLLMNVTLPVVLTVIFVKVLLLMFENWNVLAFKIKIIIPVPETVCPNVLKSLLLTFKVLVALAEPDGILIPLIAPPARPLLNEITLLLILLVYVPVGALEAAANWMPFKVPTVVPPTELLIELKDTVKPFVFLRRIPFTVPDTLAYPENVPVVPKLVKVFAVRAVPPISTPVF